MLLHVASASNQVRHSLSVLLAFLDPRSHGTAWKGPQANGHIPHVPDLSALSKSWIDSLSQLSSLVTGSENEKWKGWNGLNEAELRIHPTFWKRKKSKLGKINYINIKHIIGYVLIQYKFPIFWDINQIDFEHAHFDDAFLCLWCYCMHGNHGQL